MEPDREPQSGEKHFAEDLALYLEQDGILRMAGRILGWLLVADPPTQSMGELAKALQASKGSISTMTQLLIHLGLVERVSLPGHRRTYYRVDSGAWQRMIMAKMPSITGMRQLAEHGLELIGPANPQRRQRLEAMRDLYAFFEREMRILLEHWENYSPL
jgi:hypothetical protein